MNRIVTVYCKYQKIIEKVLFPILLCLYPLTNIRQGIDVSDATYSLANFEFFGTMDGTWMTATYLANVLGSLMMRLGDVFLYIVYPVGDGRGSLCGFTKEDTGDICVCRRVDCDRAVLVSVNDSVQLLNVSFYGGGCALSLLWDYKG